MAELALSVPDDLVEAIARRTAELLGPRDEPQPADENRRLALNRVDAAEALSMSLDSFDRYVRPEIRVIREGRLVLYPRAELERWVEENAARTLREAA